MKAVILCAGEGERLKPLTDTTPKPLLLVKDKPILSYILDSLPNQISDIFIIIQEKHKDSFEQFLQNIKINKKITILYQYVNKKGTYFALMTAFDFIKDDDKFLVLNGDDIFLKEDVDRIISMDSPSYGLGYKILDQRYRTCDLDESNQKIISFRKQNEEEAGTLMPCFSGLYTLNKDFFSYPLVYVGNEAGIPHTLFASKLPVSCIILNNWIQINTLEELNKVNSESIDLYLSF